MKTAVKQWGYFEISYDQIDVTTLDKFLMQLLPDFKTDNEWLQNIEFYGMIVFYILDVFFSIDRTRTCTSERSRKGIEDQSTSIFDTKVASRLRSSKFQALVWERRKWSTSLVDDTKTWETLERKGVRILSSSLGFY